MNSSAPFTPKGSIVFEALSKNSDGSPFKLFNNVPITPQTSQTEHKERSVTSSFFGSESKSTSEQGMKIPSIIPSFSASNRSLTEEPQIFMQGNLINFLVNWRLQQSLEIEMFKAQMQQLSDLENLLFKKTSQQICNMDIRNQKFSIPQIPSLEKQVVSQDICRMNEPFDNELENNKKKVQSPNKQKLRCQIKDIICFVLDNFGRINEDQLSKEKAKYSNNEDLTLVFDALLSKYSLTIKTKEEMVKYTLRRALKFIKANIKRNYNLNSKDVSKVLCDKYFRFAEKEVPESNNKEEFLKMILPFRKNSKNKTMNTEFLSKMFSSEEFRQDYDKYIQKLDQIIEDDNKNKIIRLVNFIEDSIKKKKAKEVKNYKRIPWLGVWIMNTKKIAQELPSTYGNLMQLQKFPSENSAELKDKFVGNSSRKKKSENQNDLLRKNK